MKDGVGYKKNRYTCMPGAAALNCSIVYTMQHQEDGPFALAFRKMDKTNGTVHCNRN
jgi:hypothetical protein